MPIIMMMAGMVSVMAAVEQFNVKVKAEAL